MELTLADLTAREESNMKAKAAIQFAIAQFLPFEKLDEVVGRTFPIRDKGRSFDLIPLPHPSGASPWHRIPPGLGLLRKAMRLVARHPAMRTLKIQ